MQFLRHSMTRKNMIFVSRYAPVAAKSCVAMAKKLAPDAM